MTPEKLRDFAEEMLEDILLNNGVEPTLFATKNGETGYRLSMADYPDRRDFYRGQMPLVLETLEADGYVLVAEIWLTGQDGLRSEGLLFHYQPKDGQGSSLTYKIVRNDEGELVRLVLDDADATHPYTGALAELFHEPKVS